MPGKHRRFRGPKFDYVVVDEVIHMVDSALKPKILPGIEEEYTSADLGYVPPTPITRGEKLLLDLNGRPDDWLWK